MSNSLSIPNLQRHENAVVVPVPVPRLADDIADALSSAFACNTSLPTDWRALLARLDDVDLPRSAR
ncbi:MAG: hypothetical protein K2P79_00285 [Sphingomonas sp.]|jgi:hypothetical protein|nr:hypothetical protein [Sphingomonas sp.]